MLDLRADAVEGPAVVDAPPAGLAGPVGRDDPHPRRPRPGQQRRRGRGRADEDGRVTAQGGDGLGVDRGRGVQQPHELRRHEGGQQLRPGGRGGRRDEGLGSERAGRQHDGTGPGAHRPQQHLQPGDVVGGQRQDPLLGPGPGDRRAAVAAAEARRALAGSNAPLGVPVEPDVATTTAVGSAGSSSPSSSGCPGRSAGSGAAPAAWGSSAWSSSPARACARVGSRSRTASPAGTARGRSGRTGAGYVRGA